MLARLSILFLLWGLTSAFIFQEPESRVKHYGKKEGLSQGVVNSITQDSQGLMWFATEDGLNLFNGYTFRIYKYDPDDSRGLADNFVQRVFKDAEGSIWVSSRKGLHWFDQLKEQFTLYRYTPPADTTDPGNDVSFITEGSAGNLWIAWYGNGFASFNKARATFTPYTSKTLSGLTNTQTLSLYEDKSGLLWVGTQGGGLNVFKVSQGAVVTKYEDLSNPALLPSLNVRCFAEDYQGNLWIGTANGLVLYRRQENKFYNFNTKQFRIAGKSIFTLLTDSNENLWIGVQGGGLYTLDLRQFNTRALNDVIFKQIESLGDYYIAKRTVLSLYEDKDKNLWIGTFGDGFYMISSVKEKFQKIQAREYTNTTLSSVQYYGMCYDQYGNLWVGTDGDGIYQMKVSGEVVRRYKADGKKGSITDNAILSALRDRHDDLWFGTYSQGIFRYDPGHDRFIQYRYAGSQSTGGGSDVRVIFEDAQRAIWVGTNRGGLCLLDEATHTYRNIPGVTGVLQNGDIRAIEEDNHGGLWIGCYGDGLYYFDPATKKSRRYFHAYEAADQLKSNVVFALRMDRKGNLWIGTGGGGLARYDPVQKELARFNEKSGLANGTIYNIQTDHADNLWLSTNDGISKYEPDHNRFYNYDVNDGLQEGQYNPGAGMYNDIAGYMCFGGTMGMNIFYPDQVNTRLKKPMVMISGFQLFNKPVEVNSKNENDFVLEQVISRTRHLTLTHKQSVFTFEFVGLDYSYPEKNRYAYKLEGLDRDWNYVGTQRSATYRYLEPGDYVFKVKASNEYNVWSDEYASIAITIRPPFWRTPVAYVLYMCWYGQGYSLQCSPSGRSRSFCGSVLKLKRHNASVSDSAGRKS